MSDVIVTPEAPAIVLDPSAPKAPVAPPAAVQTSEPEQKPSWLDARLERERKSILKELGLDSLDDGKKAVAAAKAADDAKKTEAQRAAEFETSLKSERAEKQVMAEALSVLAKDQMSVLTEAQRTAVVAVAGDDPAKQIKTITALKSTWASAAAPAASAPPPVLDTAPGRTAPKDAGSSSTPPDAKAIHAELKKSNPILAARYALANGVFE